MTTMKNILLFVAAAAFAFSSVFAKLPALSDDAKAKAAEAALKTAHAGKVEAYQLCMAQDRAAAHYARTAKALGKETSPPAATPPCADPGAFAGPAPVAATVAVSTPAAAPAAAAATKKK